VTPAIGATNRLFGRVRAPMRRAESTGGAHLALLKNEA
jgi:hypothetical protein